LQYQRLVICDAPIALLVLYLLFSSKLAQKVVKAETGTINRYGSTVSVASFLLKSFVARFREYTKILDLRPPLDEVKKYCNTSADQKQLYTDCIGICKPEFFSVYGDFRAPVEA